MAAKLKVQNFRANDLSHDSGKQVEFGRVWCEDFFEIDRSASTHTVTLLYKPLSVDQIGLTDKAIELTFGEVTKRGDRKAYAKGSSGYSQIKKFFIDDLHLTEANLNDYFAIYKTSLNEFYLYFVPALLYSNFINLFRDIEVSGPEPDNVSAPLNLPHQQIFYGAPGTGKSHTIKETTEKYSSDYIFRTTFHPDSDYSTFVGAYKPTMQELPRYNPQTGDKMGVEKKIVYTYTPQAFLKAYVKAWQEQEKPVFLIIEEINRGNCAQIFGDLFQLLDRENGCSEYPIKADQDMQMYLMEALSGCEGLPETIKSGEELALPANLYIWATMNTSDQSLFPIDSAFKRRWEWRYVKITDGKKNWKIEGDGYSCDWWTFVQEMNKKIASATRSDDKKLGYYFCKAEHGKGTIDEKTFVGKVIFYLWNDVFKDNDYTIFKVKDSSEDPTFDDFYMEKDGEIVPDSSSVKQFLINVVGEDKVNTLSNGQQEQTQEQESSALPIEE